MTLHYYVIKHKATGELMPQLRRNKGYTHWNPATDSMPNSSLFVPRICKSYEQAKRIITQWYTKPNLTVSWYENGEDWNTHSDGRNKTDLKVVRVALTEVK